MNITKEFNELYASHAPKVYRLCLGYASGNEDLAKEWQQETFIKVWNHRNSFQGKSSISTWIYRIAVNTCLDDIRKLNKHQQINENIVETDILDTPKEDHAAEVKQMYQCIDQLTPNNKTIILLELEETPQAIIAETLGIAHGAIRTRLSRIRKSLLKCITNEKR